MKALLFLWLIPAAMAVFAKRWFPKHRWQTTAMCFGAIVSPASIGLYSLYYLGPPAGYAGLLGLLLTLIHSWPGYYIARAIQLIPAHTVVEGIYRFYVEIVNGVVWLIIYGFAGTFFDRLLRRIGTRQREMKIEPPTAP